MDFGALPPEINSGRMYAGPGAASLVAASSAWNALAAELSSAAAEYHALVTALTTEEWQGVASLAMAEAVAPYIAWMTAAAAQAEQAANSATMAAAAYETAFSAMVPPPMIAANRTQLTSLVSTNIFGQNNASIAATEAQYGEMWAQDAATMYGYAGSSATASQMVPFASPPQTISPAASAESKLAQVVSGTPHVLRNLTSATSAVTHANGPLGWLKEAVSGAGNLPKWLQTLITDMPDIAGLFYDFTGLPYFGLGMLSSVATAANGMGLVGAVAAAPAAIAADVAGGGLAASAAGFFGGGPAAGVGLASRIGGLSVPAGWASTAGAVGPATAVPVSAVSAAPGGGAGHLLGGMPMAGTGSGSAGSGPKYGFRRTVMTRPPFAG